MEGHVAGPAVTTGRMTAQASAIACSMTFSALAAPSRTSDASTGNETVADSPIAAAREGRIVELVPRQDGVVGELQPRPHDRAEERRRPR